MSIKTVNSLAHYTDWVIGHVHSGANRLGRDDHHRHHVRANPETLWPRQHVEHAADRLALLDHDHWRGAVCRLDVDCRIDARA